MRLVYEVQTVLKKKKKNQHSQWFIWWTPLAGNHLHQFKAAVVQLNVRGVVVLRVDLARPQRATVFGLRRANESKETNWILSEFMCEETFGQMQKQRPSTLYMLFVFFLGLVSYTNW